MTAWIAIAFLAAGCVAFLGFIFYLIRSIE